VAILVTAGWIAWHTFPSPINRVNAAYIKVGMPIGDVVSLLGSPGPSYSSNLDYQYYIWKSESGRIRVWVRDGKVTEADFNPVD
jgi:hypothetical protein